METDPTFTGSAQLVPIADGAELPTRIELMPVGELRLDDKRGVVGKLTDTAGLIARSMSRAKGGMLPIDFGHGMDLDANADPRAAGWITALNHEGDRILATVEWTSVGAEALRGKVFRFISPTFTVSKGTGEAALILRAGLTNSPAFRELAQVATTKETTEMPQWLKQLAAKLGMPDEIDEAKIIAACEGAIDQAGHAATIVTAAGLTGDLTETAATAITAKITASGDGEPDPAKFVPIGAVTKLQEELATLSASVQGGRAETIVATAMQDGKVTPALKDWATKYATSDPEGFKTWLASAPAIVDGKAVTPAGDPPQNGCALTAEEKAICAATGVSEEAFLATKQGKPIVAQKEEA